MEVVNEVTGYKLVVTTHALDQWNERGYGDHESLFAHLKRAVPYGAQMGRTVMLVDAEYMFPVSQEQALRRQQNYWTVQTCLTRQQGHANVARLTPARHVVPPIENMADTQPLDVTLSEAASIIEADLTKASEELLDELESRIGPLQHALKAVCRLAKVGVAHPQAGRAQSAYDKLNNRLQAIPRERKNRKLAWKAAAHEDRNAVWPAAIKEALRELVTPEQYAAIIARAAELSEIKLRDQQCAREALTVQETQPSKPSASSAAAC